MNRFFNYTNKRIHYSIHGEGPPVMLVHGFGEDSSVWNRQVAFLKQYVQLIVPDLPGTGASDLLDAPDGQSPVLIDDYAGCLLALLDHENMDACVMLGHSMGGYITLAFAEKHASRLSRYGLVHSTAFADSEEKKKSRLKSIAMIEEYGVMPFLKNTTPNLFAASFKTEHPEQVEAFIAAGEKFSPKALQQYTRAMMLRPDRAHVLSSNYLPALFVIGTEDVAAPLADVIKQVTLPRISYIHVLQDTGHMGMLEAPDLLNRYLLSFLTQ